MCGLDYIRYPLNIISQINTKPLNIKNKENENKISHGTGNFLSNQVRGW